MKTKQGSGFRKEWDFSSIPVSELKACFLYEYARESRTVLAIAQGMEGYEYTDFSDQFEPNFMRLGRHNYECAVLLANIGPDLKLATTPWQDLDKKRTTSGWQQPDETKRQFLARCVRKASSFTKVRFEDAEWWESLRRANPKSLEGYSREIVSFRIDWGKPLPQLQKDALAWLRGNHRCTQTRGLRGRHAREEAKYKDALRRLGALRLWARYPLKEAIKITESCGVELYSTYLDGDGRPAHQTAWKNGVYGVVKLLQDTFALSETEKPFSWQQLERREQK